MADEPISPDEAKLNLRVDSDAEDSLITGLIVAARGYVEDLTGLVLTPRTITETATQLGSLIELASWPVISVAEIRYPSIGGVMTALPGSAWMTSYRRRPVRILPTAPFWGVTPAFPHAWDTRTRSVLPIEIDVQAGYATPDAVPPAIKQAMFLLISHFYTNRSAVESGVRAAAIEVPLGVEALLRSFRMERV